MVNNLSITLWDTGLALFIVYIDLPLESSSDFTPNDKSKQRTLIFIIDRGKRKSKWMIKMYSVLSGNNTSNVRIYIIVTLCIIAWKK